MALGATKIPGFGSGSAAATARPASGGRGVATENPIAVEMAGFTTQIGVGDHSLVYDDQANIDANARRRAKADPANNAFLNRLANAFHAISEVGDGGTHPPVFLRDVLHGVMQYEHSQRVIRGDARPGSTYNHLF